jgi:hypothetical protein
MEFPLAKVSALSLAARSRGRRRPPQRVPGRPVTGVGSSEIVNALLQLTRSRTCSATGSPRPSSSFCHGRSAQSRIAPTGASSPSRWITTLGAASKGRRGDQAPERGSVDLPLSQGIRDLRMGYHTRWRAQTQMGVLNPRRDPREMDQAAATADRSTGQRLASPRAGWLLRAANDPDPQPARLRC